MLIDTQLYYDLGMTLLREDAFLFCIQKYHKASLLVSAAKKKFYGVNLCENVKIELYAFADYLLSIDPLDFLSNDEIWYTDEPYPDCSIGDEALEEYYKSEEYQADKEKMANKKKIRNIIFPKDKSLKKEISATTTNSSIPSTTSKISLYDAVEQVLRKETTPVLMEQLIATVLTLRQDSNTKSIKSIIQSMLKSGKLRLFNENRVGLPQVEYGNDFAETSYNARRSFNEWLSAISQFVSDNGRIPFITGAKEEQKLAIWYQRINKSSDLETKEMVALYNFQQDLSANNIPQTVFQYNMQQHCAEYKAFVMRTGEMVNTKQNKQLNAWFYRSCYKYSTLDPISKLFFNDLLDVLSGFGYAVNLQ